MKFCKNCKYFVVIEPSIPICVHPKSQRDKVWGTHAPCIAMREHPYLMGIDHCGPDAKWFESNDETQEG